MKGVFILAFVPLPLQFSFVSRFESTAIMDVLIQTAFVSRKRHTSPLESSVDFQKAKKSCCSELSPPIEAWPYNEQNLSPNYQLHNSCILPSNHIVQQHFVEHMDITESSTTNQLHTVPIQDALSNMHVSSSYRLGSAVTCPQCLAGESGHFAHQKMN